MGIQNRGIYKSLFPFGTDVTAAGIQLMAGFHSGTDTGRKAEFLEEA